MKMRCPVKECNFSCEVANEASPKRGSEFIAHLQTHTKKELAFAIFHFNLVIKTINDMITSLPK